MTAPPNKMAEKQDRTSPSIGADSAETQPNNFQNDSKKGKNHSLHDEKPGNQLLIKS